MQIEIAFANMLCNKATKQTLEHIRDAGTRYPINDIRPYQCSPQCARDILYLHVSRERPSPKGDERILQPCFEE
jgi:hypothetical protein